MALRNLAAKLRSPAAAALRLPPPAPRRVLPLFAARPTRFYASFQGRPAYSVEDVKRVYRRNLKILDGVIKHEKYITKRVDILEAGRKFLNLSFVLLMPIPVMGALLVVTTR